MSNNWTLITNEALNVVISVMHDAIWQTTPSSSGWQHLWDLYNEADAEMESRSTVSEYLSSIVVN